MGVRIISGTHFPFMNLLLSSQLPSYEITRLPDQVHVNLYSKMIFPVEEIPFSLITLSR